ncbi:hypothetical protein GE061_004069 [Apolygus lucorum]|uniref:G-protein coupled receptors family 1 profile domain-containing protein n=1 Tax=Apolygus lucorum TaxID=248454 RepID=A0A8S9X244_APOLU|nr:hypothetical protein GE061_004069 [Apolygus lucorum]
MFIFVDYLFPLTYIVILNTITVIKLRRMTKNRRAISVEQRNEDKLTTMIFYVVLEFLVCTSFSGFTTLMTILRRTYSFSEMYVLLQLRDTLNTLNSSVNIVTYSSSWLPFRRSFMKMFCSKTTIARNPDQPIDLQDFRP